MVAAPRAADRRRHAGVAGAFQFSTLKDRCLGVPPPGAFLLRYNQRGLPGALALARPLSASGAHARPRFAAGVANLWWTAGLTALMVYEKTGTGGRRAVPVAGIACSFARRSCSPTQPVHRSSAEPTEPVAARRRCSGHLRGEVRGQEVGRADASDVEPRGRRASARSRGSGIVTARAADAEVRGPAGPDPPRGRCTRVAWAYLLQPVPSTPRAHQRRSDAPYSTQRGPALARLTSMGPVAGTLIEPTGGRRRRSPFSSTPIRASGPPRARGSPTRRPLPTSCATPDTTSACRSSARRRRGHATQHPGCP